jgi:hypothetical protein
MQIDEFYNNLQHTIMGNYALEVESMRSLRFTHHLKDYQYIAPLTQKFCSFLPSDFFGPHKI